MPILGMILRREVRQKQRQLMAGIAAEENIEKAAREYMEALAVFREQMFFEVGREAAAPHRQAVPEPGSRRAA
jgi:hypothetical protein